MSLALQRVRVSVVRSCIGGGGGGGGGGVVGVERVCSATARSNGAFSPFSQSKASRATTTPLASHRHQKRQFSHSRRVAVAAGSGSAGTTPSINEKLPDPDPDADADRTPFRFREFDLEGKVFIVTGGGRGLGLTLAEALVEAGGQVHCLDRLSQPDDEFHTVKDRLGPRYGGALHYHLADVRDAANLDRVISSIASSHSRLDGLIAAAGVQKVTPALEYPPDQILEMLDINYKGVYCSAISCARQMIKYDCAGSILLVASMSGLIANKGFTSSVYNSSKAAVCQLSRSLAMEWGKVVNGKPIRVNALCPGNILTPMVRKNFEDDPGLREIWERENMLGRLSQPSEYRGAALFCLSDASTFMTGSQLIIDGGYTAW